MTHEIHFPHPPHIDIPRLSLKALRNGVAFVSLGGIGVLGAIEGGLIQVGGDKAEPAPIGVLIEPVLPKATQVPQVASSYAAAIPAAATEIPKAPTPAPVEPTKIPAVIAPVVNTPSVVTAEVKPPTAPIEPQKSQEQKDLEFAAEVVSLHNQIRKREGLEPFIIEITLTSAAKKYSKVMSQAGVCTQSALSHTGSDGSTPQSRVVRENPLIRWAAVGAENIACRTNGTRQEVVDEWMKSPGHRENILDSRLKQIGIGVTTVNGVSWYAVEFGTPR